jgi:DNA-binding transcriptional ArsR family regulator
MTTLRMAGQGEGNGGSALSGVWISIAELARRKGIGRQAAMERVDRLEAKKLIETRREGRSRLVELAAYDRAVGQAGDAVKEQAVETRRDLALEEPVPSKLRDAQTERAQYDAKLRALDLGERTGKLVATASVEAAMVRAGEAIVRTLERLPSFAPEILAAAKDGEPALRRRLREVKDELRRSIGASLTLQKIEGEGDEGPGGAGGDLVDLAEG